MGKWLFAPGSEVPKAHAFGLMGILNVTPDSFSDGGLYNQPAQAAKHAGELLEQGADIIDIGAESTRPGAMPVEPHEEQQRLLPCLEAVRRDYPASIISVDTRNASTAAAALQAGAAIINDVSACSHDAGLLDILLEFLPGYVLMHGQGDPAIMQENPRYDDVVASCRRFFEERLNFLVAAGLPENRIVLDPGIGFGKSYEHNLQLLRNIGVFLQFGRPILVGVSMKSMFARLTGSDYELRKQDSAVACALLFDKGVAWHRAHDIKAARSSLLVAQAFRN